VRVAIISQDLITAGICNWRKWRSGVTLHGSNPKPLMSAMGQKRTCRPKISMSALLPKADIGFFNSLNEKTPA
jgi:hypothetical protein